MIFIEFVNKVIFFKKFIMHQTVQNLIQIKEEIKEEILKNNIGDYEPNVIAVSKTFKIEHISHLINFGHSHYGENKVQEALEKWSNIKQNNEKIKLHMLGKLQSNKVKYAVKIFDYIHSVDSKKIAQKIADEEAKVGKKIKIFIQVNLGNEIQKSGINVDHTRELLDFCKNKKLEVLGLMCLPPFDEDPEDYFKELKKLNDSLELKEISMGMSNDYMKAIKYYSTFLRIGSSIFGKRN